MMTVRSISIAEVVDPQVLAGRAQGLRDFPRIEAAVGDGIVDQVVEALEKSASTGKIGDGKIFVFDIEQVIRIRTGETGEAAL